MAEEPCLVFQSRASFTTELRGLALCTALTALVYGRSLNFDFARTEELKLADAMGRTDLAALWGGLLMDPSRIAVEFSPLWRPVSNAMYLAAGWAGEGRAWAFHAVSMVGLVVLMWAARRTIGRRRGRDLVALLIAFHPMTSAAVIDVSALPLLWSAAWAVLAVTAAPRWAALFTLLSIGCHEAGFVIPVIAAGIRRDANGHKRDPLRWLWPLGACTVGLALGGLMRWSGLIASTAIGLPSTTGITEAAAHAWFYMARLFVPLFPVFARSPPEFPAPWPAFAWVFVLVVLFAVLRVRAPRDEPIGPGFAAGFCCVMLGLLATGGMVSSIAGYGEDRLILPIVGLAWMLSSRPVGRSAGWALLTAFVPLTFLRVEVWSAPVQLWAESHRARPSDVMVSLEYGQRLVPIDPAMTVGLLEQVVAADQGDETDFKARVGLIQAWFELGQDRRALPHLARIADPTDQRHSWLLVRRCILETRFGVDEEQYTTVAVKSSLASVCDEASNRFPKDARLANAAGLEAAVRGDTERARELLKKAAELAPHNAEYRRSFSRMPMDMMGWHEDVPISPDPAAAP
ncbi:MAG: hypothetical protein VX127_17720 [Myxococcota bacterium]|nr:hypothetical protein [Myxococcota bacterium]